MYVQSAREGLIKYVYSESHEQYIIPFFSGLFLVDLVEGWVTWQPSESDLL